MQPICVVLVDQPDVNLITLCDTWIQTWPFHSHCTTTHHERSHVHKVGTATLYDCFVHYCLSCVLFGKKKIEGGLNNIAIRICMYLQDVAKIPTFCKGAYFLGVTNAQKQHS